MNYILYVILFLCFSVCQANTSLQISGHPRLATSPLAHINEFVISRLLGEGDQARVYKARDTSGKQVAVKVFYTKSETITVHPEKKPFADKLFTSDGSSHASSAEVEIGQALNHPNIIKLYEYGSTLSENGETVDFVVLEYVNGKSIGKTTLSKKEAKLVAIELLDALAHACKMGYIHRDLWSENLYITQNKKLKIIDLGSFEHLHKNQKSSFKSYWKAISVILEEIGLENALLERASKECKNCPLSKNHQKTIVSNLQKIQDALRKV